MEIQKTGYTVIGVALVILLGVFLKFYPDDFNWSFYLITALVLALIVATIIVIIKDKNSN